MKTLENFQFPVVTNKYRGTPTYFRVLAELVRAAEYHGVTTYQDVAVIMGIPLQGGFMAGETGHILGEISEDEARAGRPMLSALAVSVVSGKAGSGFFGLAKDLKKFSGDPADEDRFWRAELDAVYETWKRPCISREANKISRGIL